MLNLDHQCPSSVRRDENSTDMSAHVRKEAQLRLQVEQERVAKVQLAEQFVTEREAIKVKTKQVLDMMKQKLSTVEGLLEKSTGENALHHGNHEVFVTLLRSHCTNLVFWSGELQNTETCGKFLDVIRARPMRFLCRDGRDAQMEISTFNDITDLIVAEAEAITSLMESAVGVVDYERLSFVTTAVGALRQSDDSAEVSVGGITSKSQVTNTPVHRRPLRELDPNVSEVPVDAMLTATGKQSSTPSRYRSTALPFPPSAVPRKTQDPGSTFTVYEDVPEMQTTVTAQVENIGDEALAEVLTRMAALENAERELRSRNIQLECKLATETTTTTALRQTVQKLEGKVLKLKSSLDKSRAETAEAREALQRERDTQSNLQLRLVTEREAAALKAAESTREQQDELERLRAIVASPNAAVLSLEAQLVRVEAEAAQLRSSAAEYAITTTDLRVQLEQLQQASAASMDAAETFHAERVSELNGLLSSLQQKLEVSTAEAVEHKGTAEVLQSRLDLLNMRLVEVQRSHADQAITLSAAHSVVEQLRDAEAVWRLREIELKLQLAAYTAAAEVSDAEYKAELAAQDAATVALRDEIDGLKVLLTAERAHNAELAAQLCGLELRRVELDGQAAKSGEEKQALFLEVEKLHALLAEAEAEYSAGRSALMAELAAAMARVEELRTQLTAKSTAEAEALLELLACRLAKDSFEESTVAHAAKIAVLEAHLKAVVTERDALRNDNSRLTVEQDQLRTTGLEVQLSQAAAFTQSEAIISALQRELLQVRSTFICLHRNCANSIFLFALQLRTAEVAAREESETAAASLRTSLEASTEQLCSALQSLQSSQAQVEETVQRTACVEAEHVQLSEALQRAHKDGTLRREELEAELARAHAAAAALRGECTEREAQLSAELAESSARAALAQEVAQSECQELQAQLEFWSEKWVESDRVHKETRLALEGALEELVNAREVLGRNQVMLNEALMECADHESGLLEAADRVTALRCMLHAERVSSDTRTKALQEALTSAVSSAESAEQSALDLERFVVHLHNTSVVSADRLKGHAMWQHAENDELCNVLSSCRLQQQQSTLQTQQLAAQLAAAQTTIAENTEKGDALLLAMEACRDRIGELEGQLLSLQTNSDTREVQLHSQWQAALTACKTATEHAAETEAQLRTLEEEVSLAKAYLVDKDQELVDLRKVLEAVQTEIEVERTTAEDRLAHAQSALASAASAHADVESSLRAEVTRLTEQLVALNDRISAVEGELQEERERSTAHAADKDALTAEWCCLQLQHDLERAALLENLQTVTAELERQQQDAEARVVELMNTLGTSRAAEEDLQCKLRVNCEELAQVTANLEEVGASKTQLVQEVASLEDQLHSARAALSAALEQAAARLEEANAHAQALEFRVTELIVAEEVIRTSQTSAIAEADELRIVLAETSAALAEANKLCANSQAALAVAQAEITGAAGELRERSHALRLAQQQNVIFQTAARELKESLLHQTSALREEADDLHMSLLMRAEEMEELRGEVAELAAARFSAALWFTHQACQLRDLQIGRTTLDATLRKTEAQRDVLTRQLSELQNQLEQSNELCGDLQDLLREAREDYVNQCCAEQDEHAAMVASLQAKLQKHQQTMSEVEAKLSAAVELSTALSAELHKAKQAASEKAERLAALEQDFMSLEETLAEERHAACEAGDLANTESDGLRAELLGAQQRSERQKVSIADLAAQLDISSFHVTDLRREVAQLRASVSAAEDLLATTQDQQRTDHLQAESMSAQLGEKEGELVEATLKLQKLSKENSIQASVIAGLRERTSGVETEMSALSAALASSEATVEGLRTELASVQLTAQRLETSLEATKSLLAASEVSCAEFDGQRACLIDDKKWLLSQVEGLKTDLTFATQRIADLEGELEALSEARVQEHTAHLAEFKDKEYALSMVREQLALFEQSSALTTQQLQASLEALTAARESDSITYFAELERRETEVTRLQGVLRQRDVTITALEQAADTEVESRAQLEAESEQLMRAVASLHIAADQARAQQSQLMAEIRALHGELDRLRSELDSTNGQLSLAAAEVTHRTAALQQKEGELQAALQAHSQLQAAHTAILAASDVEHENLQRKLAALKKEYDTACGELFQRSSELEVAQAAIGCLREDLSRSQELMEQAHTDWEERRRILTADASQAGAQVLQQSEVLESLRAQLEDSSSRAASLDAEVTDLTRVLAAAQRAYQTSADGAAHLKETTQLLSQQLSESVSLCSSLESSLRSSSELAATQQAELSSLAALRAEESARLVAAETQLSEHASALASAREELVEAEAQRTERSEILTSQIAELNSDLATDAARRQRLEAEGAALTASLAAAELAHLQAEAEVSRLKEDLLSATEKLAESSSTNQRLQGDLEAALALAQSRASELTTVSLQLQCVTDELTETDRRNAALQVERDQLAAAHGEKALECEVLQRDVMELAARVTQLTHDLEAATAEKARAEAMSTEITATSEHTTQALREEIDQSADLAASVSQCHTLEAALATSTASAHEASANAAHLTAQLEQATANLSSAQGACDELTKAAEQADQMAQQQIFALNAEVALLQAKFQVVISDKERALELQVSLSTSLATAEEAHSAAQEELSDAKLALEKVNAQLADSADACRELEAKLASRTAEAEASDARCTALTAKLKQARSELDQACDRSTAITAAHERELATLSQHCDRLIDENTALTTLLQDTTAQKEASDSVHAAATAVLSVSLAELQETEGSLREQLAAQIKAAAELDGQLVEQVRTLDALRGELAASGAENARLTSQAHDLEEKLTERTAALVCSTTELAAVRACAAQEREEAQRGLGETRAMLVASDLVVSELRTAETSHLEAISLLTGQLADAVAQSASIAADLTALQSKHDDVCMVAYQHHQAADAAAAEIKRMTTAHTAVLARYQAEVTSEKSVRESLAREVAEVRAHSERTEQQLRSLVSKLEEENAALSALVTELESQSQALASQHAAVESSLAESQRVLVVQKTDLVNLRGKLSAAQSELGDSRAEVAELRADLHEKTALVSALERTRQALNREIEECTVNNQQLTQQCQEYVQRLRAAEHDLGESTSRVAQLDHALASLREVSELQSAHTTAERDAHHREMQHLKEAVRERERVAQELNVRLLSVIEGSDDYRRKAHEAETHYRKVLDAKQKVVAELERLQEEHAVLVAQDHLRSKEVTDLRERLHQSEAVAGEVRQQLAARSAWSVELSSHVEQSQEAVMRLSTELAAKETQLHRANASLAALTTELRSHEETNLKLDIQAQGLGKALQELRSRLTEQEKSHEDYCKAAAAERAKLLEKIQENEFVILELNTTLEQECSTVVELESRLEETKRNMSMQDGSGDGASDVLLARIQILDDHISDLEAQLQKRSAELAQLQADMRDRDETISSLQYQLEQLHQCQTPEATRTEYARREHELREALRQHYELQIKSLLEKLSTSEQLLATTQQELQQLHDGHPELHIGDGALDCPAALNAEEARALHQSVFRMKTKVASKSKQILLLNQQMLRDRQNFQKLKKSLVKLDGLKCLVFANNSNPTVAPPLPVHQMQELYHLGMEEGEKKLTKQHDAELVAQRDEMHAIQRQLRDSLDTIRSAESSQNSDSGKTSQAEAVNRRMAVLHGELQRKEVTQCVLMRRIEDQRLQRSEAEAAHYLALSKYRMECAALKKTIQALQQRSAHAPVEGGCEDSELRSQLAAAETALEVQRRVQEEQENKFAKAVRTLKALEARSQALSEQCVAAHTEVAALQTQLRQGGGNSADVGK
jgi:chromosome segregation ATPase